MKELTQYIQEKLHISKYKKSNRDLKNWSIENAKDGDFVRCLDDVFFIFKCLNKDTVQYHYTNQSDDAIIFHACYMSKYKNDIDTALDIGPKIGVGDSSHDNRYKLATEEEIQEFIEILKKKGYEWDDSKKELVKI